MAGDDDRPPPPTLDRVQAFSDGVFAIAITLLILPLTGAQVRDGHVVEDLMALQHQFLALGLSFAVVGRFWLLHHDDLAMMTSAGDACSSPTSSSCSSSCSCRSRPPCWATATATAPRRR